MAGGQALDYPPVAQRQALPALHWLRPIETRWRAYVGQVTRRLSGLLMALMRSRKGRNSRLREAVRRTNSRAFINCRDMTYSAEFTA
jgi:hypothetical protein